VKSGLFSHKSTRVLILTAFVAAVLAALGLSVALAQDATEEPAPLNDKLVGLSSPIEVEILNEFYADMKVEGDLPQNQVSFAVVDAGGDAIKQFGDIEAMIAQDYDGIFFLVLTPEGMDDLVARAIEQGTCVFNHSASPITGVTQNVVLDQYNTAYQVGVAAGEWINEHYNGVTEIGIMGNRADPQLAERTRGLKEGVMATAPGSSIVGEVEANTVDLGSAGTANLLQAHPDIRVILSFGDDAGLGAYTAATEAGFTDGDEFFIGSADGTQLVRDHIAENGIYQATWSYMFPLSATQWMRDMEKCLRGEAVPPTRIERGLLVTRESLDDVNALVNNPQAPELQYLYDDPSVMEYSDTPLYTPGSAEEAAAMAEATAEATEGS
jgi:ribose transport system substrate-binding protein